MAVLVFITGIDTDIGKTIATGLMARFLSQKGYSVITQKMVQTGCQDMSDDILIHRRLAGCDLLEEDKTGLTCPYLFSHAASPHLAAQMEGKTIHPEVIFTASQKLAQKFPILLIEGAGGLFVPLNEKTMIIDYITQHSYPVILVSSSKLGSINHTLLSIEALKNRGLTLSGLVYNRYPETDPAITQDSVRQMAKFMVHCGYPDRIVQIGKTDPKDPVTPDFGLIFDPLLNDSQG
ncbi:MAG: dethiobiotin synthase [Proteobacteria bacterium]|nr:dethiobiotin synthase [Pseudomonadota bacterium]MBU1387881.1 dethiobiotin synthase [Pseudomonadota bacterium]MBU1542842.1 dethiobiotin synthase [Pseudomonadota bacterium]MBU2431293.1 dethiobiotin synthase [Pseudomonadota bacterium]MBU2482961.1 dethiobiotin synthase [Pseudomonadota bacterium]